MKCNIPKTKSMSKADRKTLAVAFMEYTVKQEKVNELKARQDFEVAYGGHIYKEMVGEE